MARKIGGFLEKFCLCCALLFSCLMVVQTVLVGCASGLYVLAMLLGLLAMGAVVFLLCRFLTPFRAFPVLLFCLRLFLALGVVLLIGAQPVQDFKTMVQAAGQLAQGSREYLNDPYFYNWAYQTGFVAYEALVLRLFGQGTLPLQVMNALWMSGTGVLVYLIAKRFLSERTAMAASVFYALYPAPYFLAAVLTNQHIAVFFYYLAIWLLVRKDTLSFPRAALAGLCIAVGNVMRPLGAVVILALLCWGGVRLLQQGRPLLRESGALLLTLCVYFAAGWSFSKLVAVSGLNPQGLVNNLPLWKFLLGLNPASGGAWNQADYDTYYFLPAAQQEAAMKSAILERISSGPGALLKLLWQKTRTLWASPEDLYWGFGHLDQQALICGLPVAKLLQALKYADRGVFLLAAALALPGLYSSFRQRGERKLTLLLSFLLCGYFAVHLIIEVQSRYRYFLMPCLFLLAGAGLDFLLAKFPRKRDLT